MLLVDLWSIPGLFQWKEALLMEKDTKIDGIAAALQQRIEKEQYVAGQRLPSERDISEEFEVSRATVRAALLRLQADNSIDVIPRGGAFVRSASPKAIVGMLPPPKHIGPELKHAGSFIHAMEAQGRATTVRFLEPSSIIEAGKALGEIMEISPQTEVLRRYRIHLVDRVPFRILESYYLASLLGELVGKDEGYIPLFKWLRDHTGRRAARAFEKLNCRMPSAEEAPLLNISRSQPVIDLERWVWADDSTLFEYSHVIANAVLHEFDYSYEISEEAST
jgi:GntR family transcriptional regulator